MQTTLLDLKQILQVYKKKEEKWIQEKDTLLKTISLLQQEVTKYKALNNNLLKKGKHKRASSQEQTFIFNQTNISSYYPIVVMKSDKWTHKATLRSHLDSVRALTYVGDLLVSSGQDATVKVWQEGTLKATVRQHLGPVYSLSASNDFIFTGGAEGVIRKWSISDLINEKKYQIQIDLHEEPIWSIATNSKKSLLVTSSADGSHKMLKFGEGQLKVAWSSKLKDTPTVAEWIADNRFVSGCVRQSKLRVIEAQSGEIGWEYQYEGKSKYHQANSIKLSQKLKMIAAAHEDHWIRFFDPNTNKKIKQIVAHSDAVTGVAFRHEGFQLISCSHDGNLRFWDLRKYKCVSDIPVHIRKFDEGAVCLEMGEGRLSIGGADGLIKIFNQGQ